MTGSNARATGAYRRSLGWRTAVGVVAIVGVAALLTPTATAQTAGDDLAESVSLAPLDPVMDETVIPEVFFPAIGFLAPLAQALPQLWNSHPAIPAPFSDENWLPLIVNDAVAEIAGTGLAALSGDWMKYTIFTFYDNSHEGSAAVGIPKPIDLSGNGLYDVIVEVRDIRTTPTLRITTLPGARWPNGSSRSSIGVSLSPFGQADPRTTDVQISPGYQSRSSLPAMVEVALVDAGWESGQIEAEVRAIEPGESLQVRVSTRLGTGNYLHVLETRSPVPDEFTISS